MRHTLPPNYQSVVDFIAAKMDGACNDNWAAIERIAHHQGWKPRQVYGILGILTHDGYLRREKKPRRWVVVKRNERAA